MSLLLRRLRGPAAAASSMLLRARPSTHVLLTPKIHSTTPVIALQVGSCRSIFNALTGQDKAKKAMVKQQEEDLALAKPIDFDVASRIEGGETQIVMIDLEPGQVVRAETGALLYLTEGVELETNLGGSVSAGLKRWMTGQNMMVSDFRYHGVEGSYGTVALGTELPSKIMRVSLADYGGALICQKGAFLAGTHNLGIEMEMTRTFKAGFFGGEGFILQRLTGNGDAFIKAGGALLRRELAPGETLRVTSGALVAFSPSVQYDVQMMKGIKNMAFGGEGLFLTTLTGPGTVYLQSMPFDRVVASIASRVPRGGGMGLGVPIGMGAGGAGGEGGEGEEGDAGGEGGEEGVPSSSTSSAAATGAGFGGMGSGSSAGGGSNEAQAAPREDDVWREDHGGEGGGEFEGDGGAAEEAASGSGVSEVISDIWGSIWDDK